MDTKDLEKLIAEIIEEKYAGEKPEDKKAEKMTSGSEDSIPDIRSVDYTQFSLVENPANPEEFLRIRKQTDARIGIGRCGPRYKTQPYLRLLADHAGALDAVRNEPPAELIEKNGLYPVQTLCKDKDMYMTRPDLGKLFSEETLAAMKKDCVNSPDVQIIVSEGLSSTAIERNLTDLLAAINQGIHAQGLKAGTPVYVKYSRVPAMDVITENLKSKVTIILIGERPGLSTYESLSAYMTYEGYVGIPESKRTVISNIHSNGTIPSEAGALIAEVAQKMLESKASGTDLKLY